MKPESPPLKDLQDWMQKSLILPSLTDGKTTSKLIRASSQLSSRDKLGIYQRSYYLRLLKCMDEQFPALRQALGEELFKDFSCEYLKRYPSESYTLYHLGHRFPQYLEASRPDRDLPQSEREEWIDFMIDLAHWEQDLFVMYDAPGHEGKEFASADIADDQLILQPCFSLHQYRFPVSWYYLELREGNESQLPAREDSWVALIRKDFLTRIFPIPHISYEFLKKISNGMSIEEALRNIVQEYGEEGESFHQQWGTLGGTKELWTEAGFFIDRAVYSR